jgi:outer membrane protein OmpA-like peptidoglycan-associated protein
MKKVTLFLILILALTELSQGQNIDGRWTIGVRGGANMWFNDLSDQKVGPGGELEIAYGLSRSLSLGLLTGWELLKSEDVVSTGTHYLKIDGVPATLALKAYFSPGQSFSPYGYIGAGGMFYKRRTSGNVYVPKDEWEKTLHIPVGLGFNSFINKDVAFTLDVSYRFMDAWTDYVGADGGTDGYATAKAGLNFFMGSSDSDDDDMDGLTNGEEKKLGTDPNNPDSDADGLKDGEEVQTTSTNPMKADTDGDGLSDGAEVKTHKTNPNKADTDGDGLNDGDEVNKHKTDPLKGDTDGDGLMDGSEVSMHRTDPIKTDTDGDGLNDGDEVNKHKTDPLKMDTDGGSVSDGKEIAKGTNPLTPDDDIPIKVGVAMVLEGITFKTGSAEILPESEPRLQKGFESLQDNPSVTVEIAGHTDNTGKRETNMKLSQARADAVKNWLVNKGIDPARITTVGYGPDKPIAPNKTKEDRAKNRRIEFIRTK